MAYVLDFNANCLTSVVDDFMVLGEIGGAGSAWVYRSGFGGVEEYPDGVHTSGDAVRIDGVEYKPSVVYKNVRMKDWVQVSDDICRLYSYGNGTLVAAKSCDFDNTITRIGLCGGDIVSVPKGWYIAHAGDCIVKF